MDEKPRRTLLSEDEMDLRRGPWTVDEDLTLINYIATHGEGRWNTLALSAGTSLFIHSSLYLSIFLCHSSLISPIILPFNCLQWISGTQSSIFLAVRISLYISYGIKFMNIGWCWLLGRTHLWKKGKENELMPPLSIINVSQKESAI